MQYINAYYYPNQVNILFDKDSTLTTRNKVVYARTIKLHRGIDNTVVFTVKNSDQKPVDLTGYTAELNIIDDSDQSQLVQITGTATDAAKGLFQFVVSEIDLLSLDRNQYYYAIRFISSLGVAAPAYVDDYWNARGQIEIGDGFRPRFQNSEVLTFTNITDPVKYTSIKRGTYPTGYNTLHSFQLYFDNFTGTLTPQVTTSMLPEIPDNEWIDLSPVIYSSQTETAHISFEGTYTAIRFKATFSSGSITKILARS